MRDGHAVGWCGVAVRGCPTGDRSINVARPTVPLRDGESDPVGRPALRSPLAAYPAASGGGRTRYGQVTRIENPVGPLAFAGSATSSDVTSPGVPVTEGGVN